MSGLPIAEFFEELKEDLRLKFLTRRGGLDRRIRNTRFQKNGLPLTGFLKNVDPDRVQIWGSTEMGYLNSLEESGQVEAVSGFFRLSPCAVLVLNGLPVSERVVQAADQRNVPIILSECEGQEVLVRLASFLEARLSPFERLHGVLVDLYGVGVLIQGKSGIGKSECALHLITRGHRLVADDVVELQRRGNEIVGQSSALLKHHMEVRGLGILNIKDLFGVVAIRYEKNVNLIVELEPSDPSLPYDRLGLDLHTREIFGETLPAVRIPVAPGRNVPTLIEVAARNLLLQQMGFHSAREFNRSLLEKIAEESTEFPPSEVSRGDRL